MTVTVDIPSVPPVEVSVNEISVDVTVTGPPGPGGGGTAEVFVQTAAPDLGSSALLWVDSDGVATGGGGGGGGSIISGEVWVAAPSGNATTDTANIRAAVLASRGGSGALGSTGMSGGTIRFPAGLYLINDTILFDQYSGIISGNGSGSNDSVGVNGFTGQATVIRWADGAPTDRAMFKFTDYERILLSDIRLEGNDTNPPVYGIQSEWIASRDGNVGGTFLTLERLKVGAWRYPSPSGGWSRGMQTGIAFNGENGNNDQFAFKSLQVMGCTYRGISIENTQSIWGTIHDLVVQRCWGDAALYLSSSTTVVNYTCDLNHTDLKVDHGANVIIFGWWSERCKQNYWDVKSSSMLTVIGGKLQLNDTANASGSGPETMLGKPYMNAQSTSAVQMTFKDVSFWYGTSAIASAPPKLYWRGTNDNPTGGQAFLDGHRPTLTLIGNKGLTLDALDVQCTASSPDRAYVNLAMDGGEIIQTTITNKPIRTYIDPQVKTTSYTLKDGEIAPLLMNSASATTVTLPAASACRPGLTRFHVTNVSTGTVTINSAGGNVNGGTSVSLAQWKQATVITDGTQWLVSAA